MPKIIFTPNLERHIHCPAEEVMGDTLDQVLQNYFSRHPDIKRYVLDDQDRLRKHMQIAINNEIILNRDSLNDTVNEEDEIYVLQALSGG